MQNVTENQPKNKGALVPTKPLTQIEDLHNAWKSLEGQCNLVSPVAIVDTIPEMHAISLRSVMVDPTTNRFNQGPEVYHDRRFCGEGEVALGGVALRKIAAAAGIQMIERRRLDDRSDPNYCEIEIIIGVRDFDGTWRQVTNAKEIDLRDGAPETMKAEKDGGHKTGRMIPLDASALGDRRRHIQSLCETKAFYRAIRTILTLRQKYTKAELAKPFIVPKLIPALDSKDPDQKQALIQMALGKEHTIYNTLADKALPSGGETRTLKNVTPERTAPPASDSRSVNENATDSESQEEPQVTEADFEPLEFEPQEPLAVCACPCSDQTELTEEVARITTERCGSPRCKECYPGRGFSYDRHKDLHSLELPKHPGLTAEQIAAAVKKGKS